jgi:hypothetical protein
VAWISFGKGTGEERKGRDEGPFISTIALEGRVKERDRFR